MVDKCGSVTVLFLFPHRSVRWTSVDLLPYSPFPHISLYDWKVWVCYRTLPFPTPVCTMDKCGSVTVLSLSPHRSVRWTSVGLLPYRTLPFPTPVCTMGNCGSVTTLSLSPHRFARWTSVGLLPYSPFSHTGLYDGDVWVCYCTLLSPLWSVRKCGSVTALSLSPHQFVRKCESVTVLSFPRACLYDGQV